METINQEGLVQAVRVATREVFSTMLGMELVCEEAREESVPPTPTEGVVSLIGLAGAWVGTGSVSCSATFACKICSQMLMTESMSVDEQVLDAFAEITNMIIGNVKTELEDQVGPMGLSIPTVVFGKNFTTKSVGERQWTIFPFHAEAGLLEVKICLAPSRKPNEAVRPGFPHSYSLQG